MSANLPGLEKHARTLRAWQLAILRFAVTLDDADRLAVLMIAAEIDGLGPRHEGQPEFRYFRRTSAELCAAILRPNELTATVLREYLARIDDDRLKKIFAAAVDAGDPKADADDPKVDAGDPKAPSARRPVKRNHGLWRGLSSRGGQQL